MKFTTQHGDVAVGSHAAEFIGAESFENEFGPGVRLKWRVLDGEHAEAQASRICSQKLSPKSTLHKFVKALKGADLAAGEEIDLQGFAGINGLIVVEETDSGATRVASFLRKAVTTNSERKEPMNCTETTGEEKTLFEAACEYAEQGLRILPCSADKRPLIKGWPQKATTDCDQIRQWWAKSLNVNVAIATGEGSDLLVLDIDVKRGANGFVELEAFLGEPVEGLGAPRYRTPSGGAQLWFRYPAGNDAGIATKASIGGLSIDIRANRGYVLAPPSATEVGSYECIVEL